MHLAACKEVLPANDYGFGGSDGSTPTGEAGTGGLLSTEDPTPDAPCADQCVPSAEVPFERISMFFIGPPDEAPPCPAWAPHEGLVALADPILEPYSCSACTCCPGGCAFSTLEPCTPGGGVPMNLNPPGWGKLARECKIHVGDDGGGCPHGQSCAPTPPEGFVLCVFLLGDDPAYACPEEYPDRHVVHAGDPQDTRGCEPCACGTPDGPCAPSGGALTGALALAGPVTLCCSPDAAVAL